MPKGPRGETRPADVIGGAIKVAKIATGEIRDEVRPVSGRTRSGIAGGKARATALTKGERHEIAEKAAEVRWTRERRRVMGKTECETLVSRFEKMADAGLVDAKFFLRNLDEAAKEQVCKEVNAMYDAFEQGNCTPLDFNDSRR